jgi:hypothetical protein
MDWVRLARDGVNWCENMIVSLREFLDQISDYDLLYSIEIWDKFKTFVTTTLQVERHFPVA